MKNYSPLYLVLYCFPRQVNVPLLGSLPAFFNSARLAANALSKSLAAALSSLADLVVFSSFGGSGFTSGFGSAAGLGGVYGGREPSGLRGSSDFLGPSPPLSANPVAPATPTGKADFLTAAITLFTFAGLTALGPNSGFGAGG